MALNIYDENLIIKKRTRGRPRKIILDIEGEFNEVIEQINDMLRCKKKEENRTYHREYYHKSKLSNKVLCENCKCFVVQQKLKRHQKTTVCLKYEELLKNYLLQDNLIKMNVLKNI